MRVITTTILIGLMAGSTASAAPHAPDEDDVASATIEDRSFRSDFDGSDQKYVVLLPPETSPDQPVSLLVALHGHGADRWQFVRQTRGECRATRDVAGSHRMIMVSPDYRATTSWMGPAAESDVVQLIRTLKTRWKIRRVILCGGSMGGTAALTFTARHPKLVDAVVALNGTANLVEYDRFQDAIAKSFGGSKQQVPDEYRQRSAEFFPQRFTMPVATTTGGQDTTVPATSVLRLMDGIRQHNPHTLIIHRPAGGHQTTYDDTKRALEFVITASQEAASKENTNE